MSTYAYVCIRIRVYAYIHTRIRILGRRELRVYFGSDISELHCTSSSVWNLGFDCVCLLVWLQILENAEINNLIKIVGLQYNKKYTSEEDLKSLRYGHIMIMTDQDQDGSHIKGLLINFIHSNWPDLTRLPFLEEFITPIVKVSELVYNWSWWKKLNIFSLCIELSLVIIHVW